jgi:hypothetical protein
MSRECELRGAVSISIESTWFQAIFQIYQQLQALSAPWAALESDDGRILALLAALRAKVMGGTVGNPG